MASACVNNIGDNFPTSFPSYSWLIPRISISRDDDSPKSKSPKPPPPPENSDPDNSSINDFEFRLEDPVAMLPADELFSNGKLIPLQLSSLFPPAETAETSTESPKSCRSNEISGIVDPYLFSPKAPRCSSRWKELLGLKRLYTKQQDINNNNRHKSLFPISNNNNSNNNSKSLRNFLHRSSKSHESSLSLPLLKESSENNDSNSISTSSRLSLSSSSSGGHDEIDLPRLSLDTEKSSSSQMQNKTLSSSHNPARIRLVKSSRDNNNNNNNKIARCRENNVNSNSNSNNLGNTGRGLSVDSPRMNSSGKIVFHSLERSSSSPSSFNGGVRYKQHRGMERSYSANLRVTPVLNVPVCSSLRGSSKSGGVFGFPIFSAPPPQKRNAVSGGGGAPSHKTQQQQMSGKSKSDRV